MLTGEHVIVNFERSRAYPDRLTRAAHAHYLEHAAAMLDVYRRGPGATRDALHKRIRAIFYDEPDCPPKRVGAFCKLLDDAGEFQSSPDAWRLRLEVFRRAAARHPLVTEPDRLFEASHEEVKREIAREMGRPWGEIEAELYSDVMSHQRLVSFEKIEDPAELLRRYNIAQLQGALYKAERMVVRIGGDFKTVLRHVKFAHLMHRIERVGPGDYRIELTGPASSLVSTRRYGVQMAQFLPALIACRKWAMRAWLQTPWKRPAILALSSDDRYSSHLPSRSEYDSTVEEKFAERFGEVRNGWRLEREGEILHHRQKTFIPDFVFRNEDGTEVLMEIVGFWTPEYLKQKRETLGLFADRRILLAVHHRSGTLPGSGEDVIPYKTAIKLTPVMEALERFRAGR